MSEWEFLIQKNTRSHHTQQSVSSGVSGQTKDTLSDWANRLLKECVFVKREESGRDRYRYQDIAIILDVKNGK